VKSPKERRASAMPDANKPKQLTEDDKKVIERALRDQVIVHFNQLLGTGSYSLVYKGTDVKSGDLRAIKLIDTREESNYVKLFLPREKELVIDLKHGSIVRTYTVLTTPSHVIFVQEYAPNGDLLDYIVKKGHLSEAESKSMFRQLIEALVYLQGKHILHRDIKCENLFLDGSNNIKLGDFSFSRYLATNEYSKTYCGSAGYMATELQHHKEYTGNAADIWAAGIVLYSMTTGRKAFDEKKDIAGQNLRLLTSMSIELQNLLRRILDKDVNTRASLDEIKTSAWLRSTPYAMNPPTRSGAANAVPMTVQRNPK